MGNVAAKVTVAGEDEAVPGPADVPADVPVDAGMATVVLAVGSAEDGNLAVLTQSTRWAARPALRGRAAAAWPAPVPPPPSGRNRAVGLVLAAAGDPP